MKEFVKNNHAQSSSGNKPLFYEVCKMETGYHYCFKTTFKNTEFDKFGVGISLYFKFVKYLLIHFFLFAIISFPYLLINIAGLFNILI